MIISELKHIDLQHISMKVIILLVVLVAAVSAVPQFGFVGFPKPLEVRPKVVPVLARTEVRDGFGQGTSHYVTADGTTFEERGELVRRKDGKDFFLQKVGRVMYFDDKGVPFEYKYIADERGFRVAGAHIDPKVGGL